jgi:hypothetical protein
VKRIAVIAVMILAAAACERSETSAETPSPRTSSASGSGTGPTADGGFPMRPAMIARCGSTADVRVPARANIFGAGIAERPRPGGGGGGVAPVCVPVPQGVLTMVVEHARGGVSFSSHPGFSDGAQGSFFHRCSFGTDAKVRVVIRADGATTDACGAAAGLGGAIDPAGLVSGVTSPDRIGYLAGVFLPDAPVTAPAPSGLDLEAGYESGRFAPLLQQVFFIGDGRTSAGRAQRFRVPVGATRLYLGYADAYGFVGPPGSYADNSGSLAARFGFA